VFYPLSTQGQGPDRYNPLEQIIVTAPIAGGNYTITVRACVGVCVRARACVCVWSAPTSLLLLDWTGVVTQHVASIRTHPFI